MDMPGHSRSGSHGEDGWRKVKEALRAAATVGSGPSVVSRQWTTSSNAESLAKVGRQALVRSNETSRDSSLAIALHVDKAQIGSGSHHS